MRKTMLAAFAALALLGAISASANAALFAWETRPIKLVKTTTALDSISLPAVKDSARSAEIDGGQIAWEAFQINSGGNCVMPVYFTVDGTAAADSVYFGVELGWRQGAVSGAAGTVHWQRLDPFDITAATTSVATRGGGVTGADTYGASTLFVGQINLDTNAWNAAGNNAFGKPLLRLFLRNNAATGGLDRMRCYLSAPWRSANTFHWEAVPLRFVRGTSLKDTVNVAAAMDSVRTEVRDIQNVAWEAFHLANATPIPGPMVVFTTTTAMTAGTDSIRFGVEGVVMGKAQRLSPYAIADAVTSVALVASTATAGATGNGRFFMAPLNYDLDTFAAANNNAFGKKALRLFVRAPTVGTMTGLRAWLYLPIRN